MTIEEEAFWFKVIRPADQNACWMWQGAASTSGGHGRFKFEGRRWLAHRWVFENKFGSVPPGMVVHHTCGRPRCVNPTHLKLISQADHNTLHLTKVVCKRGHPLSDDNLRVDSRGKRNCRACAKINLNAWYARRRNAKS